MNSNAHRSPRPFGAAQYRAAILFTALALCLPLSLFACRSGGRGGDDAYPPTARILSESRMWLPADGGRTIHMPRLMGDAYTLWSPLSPKEQALAPDVALLPGAAALNSRLLWAEEDIVRRYLHRLLKYYRSTTSLVLARASHHLPIVLAGVRQQGLPRELAALPLVESAFEPACVSSAGAAGLWQLMPQTARRFGLTVNSNVDERFDVQKSTQAATRYLTYLYNIFQNWPLTIAAYNCGEGTMQKALQRYGKCELTELVRKCRNDDPENRALKEETMRFVPQFAAAVLVLDNSRELGLSAENLLRQLPNTDFPALTSQTNRAKAAPMPEHSDRLRLQGNYTAPDVAPSLAPDPNPQLSPAHSGTPPPLPNIARLVKQE